MISNKTLASLAVALAATSSAWALPTVTFSAGPDDSRPFTANTSANGTFKTFCLESNEYLDFNVTMYYDISTAAKYNNVNAGTLDPISKATAWLFKNYSSLPGYSDATSMDVQEAIWWLEGEAGGVNNAYVTAATTGAQTGYELVDANGAFGVYVMNLWWKDAPNNNFENRAQDVLVCLPVPDTGSSMVLLGTALTGLGLLRRRATA